MSWDTRIGIASLIMAFLGIGIAIRSPSKKWIGSLCLSMATLLGVYWAYIEVWGTFWAWMVRNHGPALYMLLGSTLTVFGFIFIYTLAVAIKRIQQIEQAPKGFLDYKYDAELAISKLPSFMTKLTIITAEVGTLFDKQTAAMGQVASTDRQLRVIKHGAAILDKCSQRVDRICKGFVRTGSLLSNGLIGWSQWLKGVHPNKASLGQFPEGLRTFTATIETTNKQTLIYIATMGNVRGAARIMDAALNRHIRSVQVVLDTTTSIHKACVQTLSIIDGLS